MKLASIAALSLLIAVTQGAQLNQDPRSPFPEGTRNSRWPAVTSSGPSSVPAFSTPADRVKVASQGELRQNMLPKPGFSPMLPAIFPTVPSYPTGGKTAGAVATGDLNGDGKLDLAVANECSDSTCTAGSVAVLLGNGDGTFQPAVTYNAPLYVDSVAIADLNGDGKLDIVDGNPCYPSCSGGVTVMLGNGDGTFKAAVGYAAGNFVGKLAIGDLNGDGKPDIVTNGCFDSGCGTVAVLLGNGDGTFQAPVTYGSGGGMASTIAIGDLNGDGKPDLAVMNYCDTCVGTVGILLGNGDGTFQAATTYSSGGYIGLSVAVADVNGDGRLDLVTGNNCIIVSYGCEIITGGAVANGAVGVLLGNGDGTFQAATTYNSGGKSANSVVVVDVSGDGKADVVVMNSGGGLAVLLGNGDGTFQPAVGYDSGPSAYSVAVGDVNNDGRTDLLVANTCPDTSCDGSVSVLLGSGGGKFAAATSYLTSGYLTTGLAVGDLNGDGNPDIVSANQCISDTDCFESGVSVSLGNADGTFQAGVSYDSGGYGANWMAVAVADVNGDGKPDIIVANWCYEWSQCFASRIEILLGNGDGTFKTGANYRTRPAVSAIAVADVNGDGKPDIVLADGGGIEEMLGKGDGTFGPEVNLGFRPANLNSVSVADVNNDGKPDILAVVMCVEIVGNTCSTGSIGVLLGNGDGTFQPAVSYDSGGVAASSVVVGDVNADGKPDLLIENSFGYNSTVGAIGVLLGNGDGTFQPATSWPTAAGAVAYAQPLVIADFDGDGKLDVASGAENSLLLGNGDGTFQAPIQISGGGFGTAVGDFNHDGKPDLVVNGITILLNISPGGATAIVSPSSVNFGNQTVGKGSAKQQVTLSNTGTAALNLSNIAVNASNGSFTETNNCGTSVAAGASCTVVVSWIPSITGSMTGTLTFTDNAANSPQVVALSGVGVTPAVTLSPAKLIFHTQVVFTNSPSQTATLTNTGLGILSIAKISVSGPFLQNNNCGKSVAAGASCTFTVTFKPTTIGKSTGGISITDNAGNSPQTIALSGFGTYVKLAPASLNFGNQTVGTTSLSKRVTLSNEGSVAVNITGISFTGTNAADFAETNTCGTSVAAGASCSITVTFTPSATGSRSATLSVTDDGGASPQTVNVAGTGT